MRNIIKILCIMCLMLCGCERQSDSNETFLLEEHRVYSANNTFYFNKGTYINEEGMLKFTDKKSDKTVIVSDTPNNTEKDEDNPAYIGEMSSVFVHNDKLYCFRLDWINSKIKIEKSNLDRTEIKTIYETDGMQIANYVRNKDMLYFFISSPVIEKDQQTGLMEYTNKGQSELMILDFGDDSIENTGFRLEGISGEALVVGFNNDNLQYTFNCIEDNDYQLDVYESNEDNYSDSKLLYTIKGERAGVSFIDQNEIYYSIVDENEQSHYYVYNVETLEKTQLDYSYKVKKWFNNHGKTEPSY